MKINMCRKQAKKWIFPSEKKLNMLILYLSRLAAQQKQGQLYSLVAQIKHIRLIIPFSIAIF